MKSFRSVLTPRSNPASGKIVRLYQSETAEFLEKPEPVRARITIFVFTSLFVTIIVACAVLKIDRVVSSEFGHVVSVQSTQVVQALDTSIIKTIDVDGRPDGILCDPFDDWQAPQVLFKRRRIARDYLATAFAPVGFAQKLQSSCL